MHNAALAGAMMSRSLGRAGAKGEVAGLPESRVSTHHISRPTGTLCDLFDAQPFFNQNQAWSALRNRRPSHSFKLGRTVDRIQHSGQLFGPAGMIPLRKFNDESVGALTKVTTGAFEIL